jgi:hypothetical protein
VHILSALLECHEREKGVKEMRGRERARERKREREKERERERERERKREREKEREIERKAIFAEWLFDSEAQYDMIRGVCVCAV